jgi:hypothetical protein
VISLLGCQQMLVQVVPPACGMWGAGRKVNYATGRRLQEHCSGSMEISGARLNLTDAAIVVSRYRATYFFSRIYSCTMIANGPWSMHTRYENTCDNLSPHSTHATETNIIQKKIGDRHSESKGYHNLFSTSMTSRMPSATASIFSWGSLLSGLRG